MKKPKQHKNIDIMCPVCNKWYIANCNTIRCEDCYWKDVCCEETNKNFICMCDESDIIHHLYIENVQLNIEKDALITRLTTEWG